MSLENEIKKLTEAVTALNATIKAVAIVKEPTENKDEPEKEPAPVPDPPAPAKETAPPTPPAPPAGDPAPPATPAVPSPPPAAATAADDRFLTPTEAAALNDKLVETARNLGTTAPVNALFQKYGITSLKDLSLYKAKLLEQDLGAL